jgi:hypothetical protein
VGWYGSDVVAEINDAYFNNQLFFSSAVASELARLLEPSALAVTQFCDTPNLATVDISQPGKFAYTYGTISGTGATFANYVTSMNATANAILTSYGWAEPPLCGANDGGMGVANCTTIGSNDLNNKYPVVIRDLGAGLFGYVTVNTDSGQSYNGFVGNNPNTALAETDSLASCMVINSNFGPPNFPDATTAPLVQANLDGTTSHEYVHAVQNAWGDPGTQQDSFWAESTAALFEDEVFDAGNSQYIYLYGDFMNGSLGPCTPTPSSDCSQNGWQAGGAGPNEYAAFIWFRYVMEQNGGANSSTGGEKVIQKFFENVALGGSNGFQDKELLSFKNAVESFGGTMSATWHNFAIALKFMKDCQDNPGYGALYCFEEATEYQARTANDRKEDPPGPQTNVPAVAATIATAPGTHSATIKSDFGMKWVRLPANGSANYKITLSRTSGTGILHGTVVCDTGTAFIMNPIALVTTTPHGWGTYNPTGCQDVVLVITNEEVTVTALAPAAVSGYQVDLGTPSGPGPTAVELSQLGASGFNSSILVALFVFIGLAMVTSIALRKRTIN